MGSGPKILAFAGSLRAGSYNRQILTHAARGASDAGAEVTLVELRELPLPVFDQDLEARGTPQNATRLKDLMKAHDAFLVASPEYNSSISGALKNAIDWASRPAEGEPGLVAFRGKVAALCSASPGALGGLRGLVHVRAILGNIGTIVIPDQVAVPKVHEVLSDDGALRDERVREKLEQLGRTLAEITSRLVG